MNRWTRARTPLLRVPGGRFRLAPWILNFLPAHDSYIEPFAGAASVLLLKTRAPVEVLNDLDGELVNVFRVMRDERQARELISAVQYTPFSRAELDAAQAPTGLTSPVEQAYRLLVRSWLGQGADASVRSNGRAAFRAQPGPRALEDWAEFPNALVRYCERLRGVLIERDDACEVIRRHAAPGTLIFADPPHPIEDAISLDASAHRSRCEVTADDHRRFAAALIDATGPVVFCGLRDALFDALYRGWDRYDYDVLEDGERKTVSLWLNAECERQLRAGPRPGRGLFAAGSAP